MTLVDKIRVAVERVRARQSLLPPNHVRRASPAPPPPPVPDTGFRTALDDMRDRTFCQGVKYSEQQFRADDLGAHPDILTFRRLLIKRMRLLDVPMFAHCVWRNEAEQNAAYVRGVSDARWGESPHNWGCAVDIIHGTKAWGLTERQWAVIGHIGKETAAMQGLKLEWGGDWRKPWDPAHWQLIDWRAQRRAR